MRYIFLALVPLFLLSSCRSSRVAQSGSLPQIEHTDRDVARYVEQFGAMAVSEMQRTGVPASITLAQGIIESDYGRSRLAREANNHFGIKCHSDWKGKKIYHDDDRRRECFRKYDNPEDSYTDHSDFLKNGSRYRSLFTLAPDDYKGWARGLKKAGYATNPKYAGMLIDMIEKNRLYLYDQHSMGRKVTDRPSGGSSKPAEVNDNKLPVQQGDPGNVVLNSTRNRIQERNRIQYIIVKEGDTYRSLAEDFDLLSWELFRYNDLDDDQEIYPGQLLYLQPKRMKAEAGNDYHRVREGDTMYSVSQQYGIRLKILYELNRMDPGTEPSVGDELWLRRTRPEGLR